MILKYFLLFALAVLLIFLMYIAGFGHWCVGGKSIHEHYLPQIRLCEEKQSYDLGVSIPGDMTYSDAPQGKMYIEKSLSGVFSITLMREGGGVSIRALPRDDVKLDHKGAVIKKTRYGLEPLPPIHKWTAKGESLNCPRFQFFVELYILDHLVMPIKISYKWRFLYDPEKEEFFLTRQGS